MILQIKNIFKSFVQSSRRIEVLKGLSLTVKEGEIVAIVGQSGSGKSTLLSLIAGLDFPDQGEILLANYDMSKKTEKDRTLFRGRNLGIVFQQFNLIPHLTALENVELPLDILGTPDSQKARDVLAEVGLADRLSHFPDHLSGGECQRVAIARAVVTVPQLILADEPSGNLDSQTAEHVMEMLFRVMRAGKRTLVLVTHNDVLANRCDRKLTLVDGVLR